MARVIQRKPYTATTRFQSHIAYREVLTTDEPYRKLLEVNHSKAGRNSYGRICVRHRGPGNKTKYRVMDWKRDRKNVEGTIVSVEYDPNRTAFISLVQYIDGDRRYVLATEGAGVGTKVINSPDADIKPGNALPLKKIPPGSAIHSIELKPGSGAKMVRSAGAAATLVGRIEGYVQLRLPSGEVRIVPEECYATLGTVTNSDHMNVSIGKAGRNRWKGWRPRVRGVAMNPVDHPMGGGEGRTSGGRHPCSPRGQLAKGLKTRKKNHRTDKFVVSRRKKKK